VRTRLVATNASRGTRLAEALENGASFWAKFMGLMGRASLPAGCGLWLPGEASIHMLFMRFPLDLVFVSPAAVDVAGAGVAGSGAAKGGGVERRRVVSVRRAVPPWRGVVWYVRGAKGVLELPAGTIDSTGTAVGDEILIGPA
jgi:uncharacterized protein